MEGRYLYETWYKLEDIRYLVLAWIETKILNSKYSSALKSAEKNKKYYRENVGILIVLTERQCKA